MGRGPNATISFVYCIALAALNSGGEVSGPSSNFMPTGATDGAEGGVAVEAAAESLPLAAVSPRVQAMLPSKRSKQKQEHNFCRNDLMPVGPCGRCVDWDAQTTRFRRSEERRVGKECRSRWS